MIIAMLGRYPVSFINTGVSALTLSMQWLFLHVHLSTADFYLKNNFFRIFFRECIQNVKQLDRGQFLGFVGPDLGLNSLQRFSADDKICH